jgi:hypothetical protein
VKGDSVVKKNAVKHSFYFAVDSERMFKQCMIEVFFSESVEPEKRVEGGKTSRESLLFRH